jgi:hypothetical protein
MADSGPPLVLKPIAVPGNGDCLFHAVARILIDWLDRSSGKAGDDDGDGGRPASEAVRNELAPEGRRADGGLRPRAQSAPPSEAKVSTKAQAPPPTPEELAEVARYLRSRVAMRVLDPEDRGCAVVLDMWWRLWKDGCAEKDAEMMTEMQHMRGLAGPVEDPPGGMHFSLADRRVIFRNMMDPRIYWGDEFALRTLEAVLGCRLCVVNESYHVVKRDHGAFEMPSSAAKLPDGALPDHDGPFLGLLLLTRAHYEPLSGAGCGTLAWDMRALPANLNRLVQHWLGSGAEGGGADGAPAEPKAKADCGGGGRA